MTISPTAGDWPNRAADSPRQHDQGKFEQRKEQQKLVLVSTCDQGSVRDDHFRSFRR
jgi:hypothetical protein